MRWTEVGGFPFARFSRPLSTVAKRIACTAQWGSTSHSESSCTRLVLHGDAGDQNNAHRLRWQSWQSVAVFEESCVLCASGELSKQAC